MRAAGALLSLAALSCSSGGDAFSGKWECSHFVDGAPMPGRVFVFAPGATATVLPGSTCQFMRITPGKFAAAGSEAHWFWSVAFEFTNLDAEGQPVTESFSRTEYGDCTRVF